jgi:predicted RNase H-like HicB family nuclease
MTNATHDVTVVPSGAPVSAEVAAILDRPYGRVIQPDRESGGYVGWVLEFPGVMTDGATLDETMERLNEALTVMIEVMLDRNDPIPEPLAETEYSGRITLRIPPSLHAEVARLASARRISLNRLLSDAIARYVGVSTVRPNQ